MVLICSSSGGRASRLVEQISERLRTRIRDKDSPFLWRNHFDDTRLHTIFVYSFDEVLEASELFHGLGNYQPKALNLTHDIVPKS